MNECTIHGPTYESRMRMSGIVESVIFVCQLCELSIPIEEWRRFSRCDREGNDVPFLAVWCHCSTCCHLTKGEYIPSAEALDGLAAIAQSTENDEGAVNVLNTQEVARLRRWAEARTQPPRCLDCGSHAIEAVAQGDDGVSWITHRGCGGRLVSSGIHYRDGERADVVLDAEGNRLSVSAGRTSEA